MKALTKKQIIAIILLLGLLFSLPVAIYLTKQKQEIRPRALQGNADLCFSTIDSAGGSCQTGVDIDTSVGEEINILAWTSLTRSALRISGIDFRVLYDKSKLEVVNVSPQVSDNGPFTQVMHLSYNESFDSRYNYLRLSEIAVKSDDQLAGGSVPLANITFRMISSGSATIKYPDDNSYLEIVGKDVGQ